jgi:hypothetical protein
VNQLNLIIAELQLVIAILQAAGSDTSKDPQVASLLSKAKLDLAAASQQITGQNPLGPPDT